MQKEIACIHRQPTPHGGMKWKTIFKEGYGLIEETDCP